MKISTFKFELRLLFLWSDGLLQFYGEQSRNQLRIKLITRTFLICRSVTRGGGGARAASMRK